ARRGRDRVPARAARRGTRRGPRDPPHLARARGDPVALGPDPRDLRGRDRGRARRRRERGRDRARDARRATERGRMSEPVPGVPPPKIGPPPTPSFAGRVSMRQRAGGIAVPVLTAAIAFLIGGIVVLATGHNPLLAYRDIFNGAGLNWIVHPTTSTVGTASYNLSQTLLQTTT